MSGVKRTVDYHTLKTRDLVIQNADNTFPAADGLLTVANDAGQITANRDIRLTQLVLNNRTIIDASGTIVGPTLALTADVSSQAIHTSGNIYVNNANIYVNNIQTNTGEVSTTNLRLIDLSTNTVTRLYAQDNNLLYRETAFNILDISKSLRTLRVDPADTNFTLFKDPLIFGLNPGIATAINRILRIFNERRIFIALA